VKNLFVNPYTYLRFLFPKSVVWQIPVEEKVLFLTFDDGPVPEVTLPLLELLDQYSVKATFFCVGDNVFHYYPVYKEILQRGHKTGNHTFHHLNGWKTNSQTYLNDVSRCRAMVDSSLFRPPYGKLKPQQINILSGSYKIIYWSVLSYDFDKTLMPDQCLKICNDRLAKGNIYVFHDSLKAGNTMLTVIPKFIESALHNGYRFETIPDRMIGSTLKTIH
jgi:peptidoglycan/xylan/chitin deacetylase (PgdA/CDA1 family)